MTNSNEVNSTSGYVFMLCGGVVSYKFAEQSHIARSNMQVEFIALNLAMQ